LELSSRGQVIAAGDAATHAAARTLLGAGSTAG